MAYECILTETDGAVAIITLNRPDALNAFNRQLMDELKGGGFKLSQGALARLADIFVSGRASEDETKAVMKDMQKRSGEILCPHSAVGVKVANENLGTSPMITLATAHPAKFPDAVEEATGTRPPLPLWLADLYERPERITRVENDLASLETLIRERRKA